MKRKLGTWLLGMACVALCNTAMAATIYRSQPGQPLTAASARAPAEVVSAFVGAHGRDAATLRLVGQSHDARTARTHLRFEQVIGGYRVAGAYVKATVGARGELLHLIDGLAATGRIEQWNVNERRALGAAFAHHGYLGTPGEKARERNTVIYDRGAAFHEDPAVERVLFVDGAGTLRSGFEVRTWTEQGNHLNHTLVDRSGRVVSVELRTNTDSYNVFTEDPGKTPQAVVAGPGAGNAESPMGWLGTATQLSIDISGNNANAYLDAQSNNRPDRGGSTVTTGDFLAVANLAVSPSTVVNRDVAVQNLFYLNNVIHDILYGHGFTETAGNFQEDNFGKGGKGSDSVLAEAQDGGGTDNANFATPSDGRNPRMQMYLWSPPGPDHEVVVNAPAPATHAARGAVFGPVLDTTGLTGDVVLVNDGVGTPTDGCEGAGAGLSGKIALIDRGTCTFVAKVLNAQSAGAIGVIIANNNTASPDEIFTMGGDTHRVRIPPVMVSYNGGQALKASAAGLNATLRKDPNPLPMVDADLDSDIVYHEYGHGLSWRMIGGMSGPMSGAIGEGASDTVAFLVNGDDVVAEYSASDPGGIRRNPYANYPRTYQNMAGTSVHDDGEIYAAAMWRVLELFRAAGRTDTEVMGYFVDGMNFTPATPAFEDMRDGMLQSAILSSDAAGECMIWHGFAQYGVGVGASGTTSAPLTIVESFALPGHCP